MMCPRLPCEEVPYLAPPFASAHSACRSALLRNPKDRPKSPSARVFPGVELVAKFFCPKEGMVVRAKVERARTAKHLLGRSLVLLIPQGSPLDLTVEVARRFVVGTVSDSNDHRWGAESSWSAKHGGFRTFVDIAVDTATAAADGMPLFTTKFWPDL